MSPLSYYKYFKNELEKIALFPERELRDIVYHLTGKDMGSFLTKVSGDIDLEVIFAKTHDIVKRRRRGEPLEYILGRAWFMDIELKVDESVLIPRPETEILVEEVLKHSPGSVIDIGTGSGNIAVMLAKHGFRLVATDISERAIKIAKFNAKRNGVKIEFLHSAFMDETKSYRKFDYIVSNPPYVSPSEYTNLHIEVRYEPYEALVSPENGLWHSLKILEQARKHLKRGGYIFLEISPLRVTEYKQIAESFGYREIEFIKDLNGENRVLKARWM